MNQMQTKIKILNVVLNHIRSRDWTDYDNFSDNFSDEIIRNFERDNFDLEDIFDKTKGHFLRTNHLKKQEFLTQSFKNDIIKSWHKAQKYQVPVCRFSDIFPEINKISDNDIRKVAAKIDIPESKIQEELRDALRDKNGAPISQRGKDSVLEVADLEHFELKIGGIDRGISAVVKGYRSVAGKLKLKDIMHQMHKAYRSHPDYILLVSAREMVDGVRTELKTYGNDVGNSNLVIIVLPMDLAKFLRWRKII